MKRKFWYVSREGDVWKVSEDWGRTQLHLGIGYSDQTAAVEHACMQAERHHKRTHLPTGVRVRGLDARWREESFFGSEEATAWLESSSAELRRD